MMVDSRKPAILSGLLDLTEAEVLSWEETTTESAGLTSEWVPSEEGAVFITRYGGMKIVLYGPKEASNSRPTSVRTCLSIQGRRGRPAWTFSGLEDVEDLLDTVRKMNLEST